VRSALVLAVFVAAVAIAGCERGGEGEVLARVEGSTLTVEQFYASIPEDLLAVMSLDDQEEALRTWVKTELFYQEGLRRGIGDDEDLRRRMSEIERELVAEEYIRRFMEDVPNVTDEEARAYFDAHSSQYAIQVRLAHILVRNRQEADRALAEVRSGTPFETIAANVSIDQTASLGGDLGYMRRGEMIHELEAVAFDLNVGDVSDVIPSSYGYHIIKVLDRHPGAGQPSFDSKYGAVMNFLTSVRRREAFDGRLLELEEHTRVVVDTARLRAAARARIEVHEGEGYPGESGDVSQEDEGEGTP
jgi:parvulin-like peptidyl-prolyl isomerase